MITPSDLEKLRTTDSLKQSEREYEEHLYRASKLLSGLKDGEAALSPNDSSKSALDLLDPAHDTLSYLFILTSQVKLAKQNQKKWPAELASGSPLLQKVVEFLLRCDRVEIRFGGLQWRQLVETVIDAAQNSSEPTQQALLIRCATTAILRLDPAGTTFTSAHLSLARCALSSRQHREVLPLLDKEMTSLPSRSGSQLEGASLVSEACPSSVYITQRAGFSEKLKIEEVQEYFVLGALIFIGVNNWGRAKLFLEHVLSTPTSNIATGYMTEAYRKWLLINLFDVGHISRVPGTISQNAVKQIRGISKPYIALVDAFTEENHSKLLAEVIAGTRIWAQDGNTGLVQRTLSDHRRRSVMRLGQVYVAVPIKTVTQRLHMSESSTKKYLEELVDSEKIHASVERSADGSVVLRFSQDSANDASAASEMQLRAQLIARTKRLKTLTESVTQADEALSKTVLYLEHEKTKRHQADRQNNAREDAEMVDPPGHQVSDEELMEEAGDNLRPW